MTSYSEYVEQIAKLQALADAARQEERDDAIQKVKDLMQLHGLKIEDLAPTKSVKETKSKGLVPAQFKDPTTGATWTGRGRAPRWLDGKEKEQFRITK